MVDDTNAALVEQRTSGLPTDLSRKVRLLEGDYLCDGCDRYRTRIVYIKTGAREVWLCYRCVYAFYRLFHRAEEEDYERAREAFQDAQAADGNPGLSSTRNSGP